MTNRTEGMPADGLTSVFDISMDASIGKLNDLR